MSEPCKHGFLLVHCPQCDQEANEAFIAKCGPLTAPPAHDPVNRPKHYSSHPSGIEAIQITEHMNFCVGNAMKYLWRAGEKGDAIEDLRKAEWYINREIDRLTLAAERKADS